MKIRNLCICTILILAMMSGLQVQAQDGTEFIASKFDQPMLDLTNDAIDSGWDAITYYNEIPEFGDTALVKFANNQTHLFSLITIDSTKEWAAIEFGAYDEFCMVDGNDGWTFYIDQSTGDVTAYDELYTGSAGPPEHDTVNDLNYAVIQEGGYHKIEVVRAMDTGDTQDLAMNDGDLWNVKFASSTNHAKGGLDNPTEFGPSEIYSLSVQTGGEIVVPNTPDRVDYDFWKMVIFIGVFVSAAIFVTAHTLVRQIFRPLDHPNQIVDKDFRLPTIKTRWEETFGKKDTSEKMESTTVEA